MQKFHSNGRAFFHIKKSEHARAPADRLPFVVSHSGECKKKLRYSKSFELHNYPR